ncbi:MAG: radical SAM protein, partial [Coleofasciculus sp. S288]|nr:radical SAM protein [Coleofasciculus sp. S288]
MGRSMNPGSFRPSSPFHMVWLATNRCNARCAHCSSNSSTPYPDELSQEEACDLMDQFAEAGVVDLAISGGEPLLRQDLFEIIAHARSRGLSVGVGSNGAVLSQETAIRLVESGINRFQVSLDGQAAEHEALRCWNGLFDRALQMIQRAREVGLRVHVCCTINRLNWQILESFTELVSRL